MPQHITEKPQDLFIFAQSWFLHSIEMEIGKGRSSVKWLYYLSEKVLQHAWSWWMLTCISGAEHSSD